MSTTFDGQFMILFSYPLLLRFSFSFCIVHSICIKGNAPDNGCTLSKWMYSLPILGCFSWRVTKISTIHATATTATSIAQSLSIHGTYSGELLSVHRVLGRDKAVEGKSSGPMGQRWNLGLATSCGKWRCLRGMADEIAVDGFIKCILSTDWSALESSKKISDSKDQ
jgi:hypothetical protein